MTGSPDSVRLDIWLDISCLFKTRSDASRQCSLGRVRVNGTPAKPHRLVRAGDEITITRPGGRVQVVVVRGFATTHIPKADARRLYDDRSPIPSPEILEQRRLERLIHSQHAAARPDRRARRERTRSKWST